MEITTADLFAKIGLLTVKLDAADQAIAERDARIAQLEAGDSFDPDAPTD